MKKRLEKLLCVKSIVTLTLTGVFSFLSLKGFITPAEFVVIFTVIINYYFESQRNKDIEKGSDENVKQ